MASPLRVDPSVAFRSRSLRWRLPALMCALFLILLTTVLYASYHEVEEVLIRAGGTRAQDAAVQIADLLRRSAAQAVEQARRTASAPALRGYFQNPTPATLSAAQDALKPLVSGASRPITVWDANGTRVFDVTPSGVVSGDVGESTRPPGDGVSGFYAVEGRVFSDVTVPIRGDPLQGGSAARLGTLSERSGLRVSPPDVLNQLVERDARIFMGNRAGDVWTDLTAVIPAPAVPLANDGIQHLTLTNGERRIGGLKGVAGTPWAVWVDFSRTAATAEARVFVRRMTVFGLVVVAATWLSVWWLTKGVTVPLADMTRAAEAIAGGGSLRRVGAERADEIGRLGRAFDVLSEQNRAREQAKQMSEARYRALFEYAPDGIVIADREGRYLDVNPSLSRMLGYGVDELIGKSAIDIVTEGEVPYIAPALATILGANDYHREWQFRRKDGSVFSADVIATTLPDGNVMAMIRDITERNQAAEQRRSLEEQFQQAQKMEAVGRLAGGIAHDFNNLLTMILGSCELSLSGLDAHDPRRPEIEEIQRAGTRAAELTRQLLAFSRKQIIELTRIDLSKVVAGMRPMLERLIGEDVRIVLKLSEQPAVINADRGQIEQIVMNLAVNARDAMPRGGVLSMETATTTLDEEYAQTHLSAKPGAYTVLTVTDTGSGMTPEVQARLFEPFFTTKEAGKGTGLGMATVYGIVARSGGTVGVYSEIGRGTSVKVYFPEAGAAAAEDERPLAPSARGGSETVLVVEDEPGLRELTKKLLLRQGYRVLTAAGTDEARQLLDSQESIDVLLTDVVMPGGSGPDLTSGLLSQRPDLRIVYMSGYTEETIVHHGVLDPGIVFLHKPFTSEMLGRKIREALSR